MKINNKIKEIEKEVKERFEKNRIYFGVEIKKGINKIIKNKFGDLKWK